MRGRVAEGATVTANATAADDVEDEGVAAPARIAAAHAAARHSARWVDAMSEYPL